MPLKRLRLALFPFALLILASVFCPGCAGPEGAAPPPVVSEGPWNLTIFHTNDIHGGFLAEPATWRDDRAMVGGFAALASHLAEQRADAPASLLLDGGDFMTGNPVCDIPVDGVKGAAIVEMMNLAGYEASVVGNHEFDNGRENLQKLERAAGFPLLAADILDENGDPEFPDAPVIIEKGGLKIGVMGVSCEDLFAVTADSRVEGLKLRKQAAVVREMASALDPVTDLMVLITHNGVRGDTLLARGIADAGIDVIVGSHSHTRLKQPLLIGNVLVVQAGSHLKNLGRLDLQVADDRVVSYSGRLITLYAEGRSAGPELGALIDRYAGMLQEMYGQEIGRLAVDWRRTGRAESNIGDWLADALRDAAGADVGLINSGTIRKNISAGPVTALDIHQLLPFSNTLVVFEADADQLRAIAAENARSAVGGRHGILQVSGLTYRYRAAGEDAEMIEVKVGGQPLESGRVYKVACPDYVVQKADLYLDIPAPATEYAGMTITEAVLRAVRTAGTVTSRVEGRIVEE